MPKALIAGNNSRCEELNRDVHANALIPIFISTLLNDHDLQRPLKD
jgi:hypothetical protein